MRSGNRATEDGLRQLLNVWDPIGVADEVPDEYDCMHAPLLRRLRDGAGRAEIAAFLRHELVDHFGLAPGPSDPEETAARLVTWWTTTDGGAARG
ncbi:hypothetical protein ACFUGD_28770 [Streptomyces sp. NPDC057217]|uniref:hypothetical protein n=1 Tax=unclassified Streptomyces TaxID=2593676 RepID=UPI0036403329